MNWCSFCEDIVVAAGQWKTYGTGSEAVTTCNYDSIQTLLFAQYLLRHRDDTDFPPGVDWKVHVPAIINFVERRLIFWDQPGPPGPANNTQPAIEYGARSVSEQRADEARMSVHTTRYASTLKQYADAIEETDPAVAAEAREQSRRSWAWASYCLNDAGLLEVTPGVGQAGNRTWFSVTVPAVGDTLAIMGYLPPALP
jgi:hypothetical protein